MNLEFFFFFFFDQKSKRRLRTQCEEYCEGREMTRELHVLMPVYRPVVLDPFDSIWNRLIGRTGTRFLWRVCKRFSLFWFLCYIVGASVLFYSASRAVPPTGSSATVLAVFECLGVFSATLSLGFFRVASIKLIFRTFEGFYLSSLLLMSIVSAAVYIEKAHFLEILLFLQSLNFILWIDAAPLQMAKNKMTAFNFLFGGFFQVAITQMFTWSSLTKTRVHDFASVEIPAVGKVSLFQRFFISPLLTSAVFFFKYFAQRRKHPERTVLVYTRIKEMTFGNEEELRAFLNDQNAEVLRDAIEMPARHRNSIHVLTPSFMPTSIDHKNDTILAWMVGPSFSKKFKSFVRKHRKAYFLCLTCGCLASCAAACLIFIDLLPSCLMPLPAFIISFSMLANTAMGNMAKARILARTFEPVYLGVVSLTLSFGLFLTLSDCRAAFSFAAVSGAIGISLFDAQTQQSRASSGGTTFVIAIALDFGLICAFYFNAISDVYVIRFTVPGSVTSVSSVQAFIIAPVACLVPFHFRMLFVWIADPRALLCIKSYLVETPLKQLVEAKMVLSARKRTVVSKIASELEMRVSNQNHGKVVPVSGQILDVQVERE